MVRNRGAWGFPQILPHYGLIQHQLHGNKAVLSMLASNPEGPAHLLFVN